MRSARLPTLDTLPLRWSADDAHAVLASLASSGLSAGEFSRRTGIQLQRIRRWQGQLSAPSEGLRLIEVVPLPVCPVPAVEVLEVTGPGGWVLRVPPTMLVEVLRALSEAAC